MDYGVYSDLTGSLPLLSLGFLGFYDQGFGLLGLRTRARSKSARPAKGLGATVFRSL